MNNQLDVMDHSAMETASYWQSTYLPDWTFWNYLRAIATTASAICYLVAVVLLAQAG